MNVQHITDVEIDGIDYNDYPDFCDAFLAAATYNNKPLTQDEMDTIQQENPDWFYSKIEEVIY